MSEIGEAGLGSSELGGALFRDPPVVAVTAPSGPQDTETVTVTWTYTSALSKPQTTYRIQILDQVGTTVLYDSGAIAGTDLTFACPFVLSGGSLYTAKVICSDGADEGFGLSAFSADLTTLGSFAVSTEVGSVYEVAINGQGYRLSDSPERPYRRSVGQLQAPRLATGDTPFSEAIERYTFVGAGDWSLGAGQEIGSRQGSDARAFWDSENVNPFEPGQVSLLTATEEILGTTSSVGAVVASGHLFVNTDTDEVQRMTSRGATPDVMTFTGDTVSDMCSDGTYWYVSNTDDEIFRGTGTTIGSVWCNLSGGSSSITEIKWCSDRLGVIYTNGSGQSVISTIGPAGSEEVAAGRFKFDNASCVGLAAGDGYMWWGVNRNDRSVIYAWQLGSADGAFIALDLPYGEHVEELFFYLGNVMVRAGRADGATIYRAVPSSGELTPERVVELEGTNTTAGAFGGFDRFIVFGWQAMSDDGRDGLGCIDLSTGGWCRWTQAASAGDTGVVTDVFVWDGLVGFVVNGGGVQYEDPDTLSATGYVTSSVTDLQSSLVKVFDSVSVSTSPIPADGSVDVQLSYDAGVSFTAVGSIDQPGLREGRWDLGAQGTSVSVKVVLNATGVASPKVTMTQVKLHPLSVVDAVVELPISCAERQSGLNGMEVQASRGGMQRARVLESLVGTRVQFQDVDYPSTGLVETWEMVSAEYSSVGVFERRTGARQEAAAVCVCTLRRAR